MKWTTEKAITECQRFFKQEPACDYAPEVFEWWLENPPAT